MDCFYQVVKNEGAMSLMKGAGANILRGVAGAGVLAGFDSFKALYISWRLT
ncbi:MC/SLC25 family protein [Salmonella sp. s51933]|uniref:MC/SLC25 family protein n=1 Tax=Salmonella sp. s51933 TaxID=3160127 RepID=UPI00375446BE